MIRFGRSSRALAAGLAALAGFVDASGYIASGGYFLSFMSGNSTRLGLALVDAPAAARLAAGLIAAFVAGVTLGTLAGQRLGLRRRAGVLILLALVLAGAALAAGAGQLRLALLLTALAMGAENTVFEAGGDTVISLTYMTGNLVKVGQRLALALGGGAPLGWLPYLLLWSAMLGGAVAGAWAAPHWGLAVLWLASGAALLLALAAWTIATD
ncbi:MAG: hypothetical protein CFE37_02335 [Alphaproteobacteria bacterium PA4]|nr:MAG: hypothetical protein CFE37_02335 [Alphaproteobacteria bacterium PA4]